jgi:undecaprenyl diphosphate synthase
MTEDEAREAAKKADPKPRHVAVIMDGNGRWASQRGLSRIHGHHEGRKATKRLVQACGEISLEALTVYSFSVENWARPSAEVNALMALIENSLAEEVAELDESNVRFIASGRLHQLPESLQRQIDLASRRTGDNTGLILNLAVNYGGRTEVLDACRALVREAVAGRLTADEIEESHIAARLYHPELPDPDLLIRTAGEMRISNFLLWESAYSELIVLPVLWPDFQKQHLFEAVIAFGQRERRFGRVQPAGAES